MRLKNVVGLGLASLLAIAVAWKVSGSASKRARGAISAEQRSSPGSARDARTSDEQLNQLQGQVAELRQQVALQRLAAERLATASAEAQTAPPPVESATPDRGAEQRRLEEYMQGVLADFEAQPRDANWARDRNEDFQKSFARSNLLKQAVQSVDCRSTTCRVEMLDDRSPDFFKQLNDMVSSIGSHLPSMAGQRVTRPDGTAVAIYFFSKDS